MDALPPIGFFGAALIKKNEPPKIEEGIKRTGVRVRKGKVMKRGDISR